MLLLAPLLLAGAVLGPPGLLDDSNARTVHSWNPTPDCQDWTRARRSDRARSQTLEAWVTGLLTGYNLYDPNGHHDILRGTNLAEAFAWIDRRCGDQPEQAMVSVAIELVHALRARAR